MSACPITDDEQERLDGFWAAICSFQGRQSRPRQLVSAQEFLDAGLPAQDLADASSLGFTGGVDEYLRPDGQRGWIFRVLLTRGGETWGRAYCFGEWIEAERPWAIAPAPLGIV